jgi:hypothetical protein
MARTPEGKIKDKVSAMLQRHGFWYFLPGNNGFGKSGIPDFICCIEGQFVGIECKATQDKQPTALQLKRKVEIRTAGGMWFLIGSQTAIDDLERILLELNDR